MANNGSYYYNSNNNVRQQNDAYTYEYRVTEEAYIRNSNLASTMRWMTGFFGFISAFGGPVSFLFTIAIFGSLTSSFSNKAKRLEAKLTQMRMKRNPVDVPKMEVKKDNVNSLQKESEKYLKLIRQANDAIPGEEISKDIYDIEQLTREIFNYAIKNPDKKDELKSFFSYYLPTTLKLLNTYVNLEEQPIQTQQIRDTKKEIQEMLKKIKQAFSKLYDQIFDITAMDISSEIAAMEGMMSSQGLLNQSEEDLMAAVKKYRAEEEMAKEKKLELYNSDMEQ